MLQERTITLGEVQRFFKDLNIDMSTKELGGIIKQINDFFLVRYGSTALEF